MPGENWRYGKSGGGRRGNSSLIRVSIAFRTAASARTIAARVNARAAAAFASSCRLRVICFAPSQPAGPSHPNAETSPQPGSTDGVVGRRFRLMLKLRKNSDSHRTVTAAGWAPLGC
jgi:hypothetical protein